MLTHGTQAAFFGHLYESAGVAVHSTDARVYARQHPAAFDLIISRSSNTFAALSSGAFALAENYLFTTEALADFYRALTADGILLIEHQVYIPRLTSAALESLRDLGLAAENHIAVYDLPTQRRQVLVLGRQPLARTLVDTTLPALFTAADSASRVLHPAPTAKHLISRIVADGWEAHWSTAAIDISPPTDDRPFVAQMGRWDRLDRGRQQQALAFEFAGFPLARLLVVAVLAVVVAVGVPLLLLPRRWGQAGLSGIAWLYFAAIGMGYMLIEVVWIQQYSLLLGHSAYTFPIVLLGALAEFWRGKFLLAARRPLVAVRLCRRMDGGAFAALSPRSGDLWRSCLGSAGRHKLRVDRPAGLLDGHALPRAPRATSASASTGDLPSTAWPRSSARP